MSRKIQFHTFHLLFRLFSYLADKSGGWSMFVRPKMVMGGVIIGLGVSVGEVNAGSTVTDNMENQIRKKPSPNKQKPGHKNIKSQSYTRPVISCYDIDIPEEMPDTTKSIKLQLPEITCYVKTDIIEQDVKEYDKDGNEILIITEQMPLFPGGVDTMMKYIEKNISYPQELRSEKVTGLVICNFIINTDGALSDIKVVRGLHSLLDQEAIRIVKSFPKWSPGKQDGKAVPVKFTLPIRFTLPKK